VRTAGSAVKGVTDLGKALLHLPTTFKGAATGAGETDAATGALNATLAKLDQSLGLVAAKLPDVSGGLTSLTDLEDTQIETAAAIAASNVKLAASFDVITEAQASVEAGFATLDTAETEMAATAETVGPEAGAGLASMLGPIGLVIMAGTMLATHWKLVWGIVKKVGLDTWHFIDNDVLVSPGWLERLVECAEETNADVVGPLIRQIKVRRDFAIRYHTYLHYSGGDCGVREEHRGNGLCRHLYKETHNHGHVVRPRHGLTRQQVRFTEFHCTLVRSAVFAAIGWLDESIYCEEHVDFCLLVHEAGRTIFFEPGAVVTFVPGPLLEWTDVPVYLRRWSDAWELASYARLREKWDLTESEYFMVRYGRLGLRRREKVIKPLSRWMLPKRGAAVLAKILTVLDSAIHRAHRSYFFWRRGRSLSTSLPAFGLHRYSG